MCFLMRKGVNLNFLNSIYCFNQRSWHLFYMMFKIMETIKL